MMQSDALVGAAEWGGESCVVGRQAGQCGAARAEEWTARVAE